MPQIGWITQRCINLTFLTKIFASKNMFCCFILVFSVFFILSWKYLLYKALCYCKGFFNICIWFLYHFIVFFFLMFSCFCRLFFKTLCVLAILFQYYKTTPLVSSWCRFCVSFSKQHLIICNRILTQYTYCVLHSALIMIDFYQKCLFCDLPIRFSQFKFMNINTKQY